MTRTSHSTKRLVLAGLIAGIGSLGLHASEPLRGFEFSRRAPSPNDARAHSATIRDRHMLRVTLTDGQSLLTGITVTSGARSAVTDASGFAMLRVDGWPYVPVNFIDAEGQSIGGSILLPETPAEGVDALVTINPFDGTFETVAAAETGPERAALAAARADLEAHWLAQGIKEDFPVSSLFAAPPALGIPGGFTPGTNGEVGASLLQFIGQEIRQDRGEVFGQAGSSAGLRRNASRLRMNTPDEGLIAPATDFHKRGVELLMEFGLLVEDELNPKVAETFGQLVDSQELGDEGVLAVGAELLRQGVALDPALTSSIHDAMADAGISNDVMQVHGGAVASGQVTLPGLPSNDVVRPMTIDGFEPDNTPATCGTIPNDGTPQDRGIDPAGDLDYICFTANCGDWITIETGPIVAGGTGDTQLELYDPDGLLIAADDTGAATSLWSLIETPADKTGVHIVKVRGFTQSTFIADYRVTVLTTPGPCNPNLDPAEPNDTSATCAPVPVDGSYAGHYLRPLGDEDWFCFDVTDCGQSVTIDINEIPDTDISVRFRVFDPSGAELINSISTVPQTVGLFDPGTYRLQLVGGSTPGTVPTHDNSTDQNTGRYELSVLLNAAVAPCDAFEPDNTQGQCNPIAGDGVAVVGHSISPVGDEDWYCVQAGCNDSISITVTPTPSGATSLRPRVELWDPISTAVLQSVTGTVNGNPITLNRTALHAGTWYIKVLRASTVAAAVQTGTYNIAVTLTAVPNANCDFSEPDSDAASCQAPIDYLGTIEHGHTIFPARDSDWICLGALTCGDTVTVQTYATPPANLNTDTYVELYKLPNTLLTADRVAFDDDGGGDPFSRAVFTLTSVAQNGVYVAKVRHFSTTGTGPYSVSVLKEIADCPEPDAFEPDDTSDACTPLPGAPLAGHSIFPGTDTDFYCVSFACGDNLDVTVTPTGGSVRPIVALLNAGGSVVQTITSPANGMPVTLSTTDNNPGPHFIRVTSSGTTTGNYIIESTTSAGTCLLDPFEPDDTRADCRFIGLPRTESRAINPATDSDYYCFSLDCGQGVNVTVTPTNGTLRAIVRFRSPTNGILMTVTAPAAGETVTLSSAASAPGIYAIEVDSSTSTKGLYDITLEGFDGFNCIDSYEPDNTRDACNPIATDGTIQDHTLLLHPDEDWVCFDVVDCGTRITAGTVQASPMYDDADTTVELYGPLGNLLVSATGGGPASHGRLSTIVNEPGSYAVRVIPASTAATSTSGGQYGLHVTLSDVKAELIVPPVVQTELPGGTQLDAQALTPSTGDYAMIVGSDAFIDISTTGTHIDTGLISVVVPIGFSFNYYGNSYTDTAIHDNGLLSFSNPTWIPGIGNDCIPDPATPNEFIAVFWEDLDGDDTYYETIGTAPNRMFIAQWNDGYFPVTIQAILFEGTNEISLRYLSMNGTNGNGQSATIGIEDLDGNGIQYSCNTASVFDGMSISFIPGGPDLVPYSNSPACFPAPAPYDVTVDTASFIDISTTGDIVDPWIQNATLVATDEGHTIRSLPFVFPYFDGLETSVVVHTNGFVSFGPAPTASTFSNTCTMPSTALQNGIVAGFWDDLNVLPPSAVYTQFFDPTPDPDDAYYVVQWNEVPFFVSTGANTFQIILFENGNIEYRYGAMDPSTRGSGNSATIGLENRTGTVGVLYSCNTVNSVFDGMRLTFSPSTPPAPLERFTWLDPATDEVLGTGATYLHPIDGPCEVLLRVEVRDPTSCCTIIEEQLVTVADRSGPTFHAQPSFGVGGCQFLWPPNHGYADFSLADAGGLATDNCGGVTYRFSAASNSSQPEDATGTGDGGSVDDIMISPDGQTVSLRAERNGGCNQLDRSYELFIEAVDGAGNVTLSEPFAVCVYHDRGHQPPGPYRGAEPGSDSDDTRPGWIEGTYGTGCGDGCDLACDPTQLN